MRARPRTGNYTIAALYSVGGVLYLALFIYTAILPMLAYPFDGLHDQRGGGLFALLLIGVLPLGFLLMAATKRIVIERTLRAAADQNDILAPPTPHQPAADLAFPGGTQRRTVQKHPSAWTLGWVMLTAGIILLLFVAIFSFFGLSIIATTFPPNVQQWVIDKLTFNFLNEPYATAPTPLQWFVLAIPVFWVFVVVSMVLIQGFRQAMTRISLDDTGFVILRWGRLRHFQWGNIRFLVRDGNGTKNNTYWIGDSRHAMCFSLFKTDIDVAGDALSLTSLESILATILHRAPVVLRSFKLQANRILIQRIPPTARYSVQDIAHFPTITLPQPTATTLTILAQNHEIELRPRLAWGWIVFRCCLLGSVLLLFTVLFFVVGTPPSQLQGLAINTIAGYMAFAFYYILICSIVTNFASEHQHRQKPTISLNFKRLSFVPTKKKKTEIAWRAITGWAVAISSAKHEYILFTNEKVYQWTEPADAALTGRDGGRDRQAAYQQRATEVHACIAYYSGQPLRQIPT